VHWLHRHRLVLLGLIVAFWTTLVALAHFFPSAPFLSAVWSGERSFFDLLRRDGRKTAVHPDFVFVGIDQQSLQLSVVRPEEAAGNRALELMIQKPYPWSREVWALLMDKLFGAGARLVIFDIVFSSTNEGDPAFRSALDKYRDRVVIGSNIDIEHNDQLVLPNGELIAPPQELDDRVGFVTFWRDVDGLVRHAQFHQSDRHLEGLPPVAGDPIYDSLDARALKKLGRADSVPPDLNSYPLRFGPPDAYSIISPLYEIFSPKEWHANYKDGAFFRDKVVIVGAAADIQHDFVATPVNPNMHGPVLHLQTLAAALDHEFLREIPSSANLPFILVAALLAWCVVAFARRPLLCILVLAAIAGGYLIAARVLYDRAGLFLIVVPPVAVFATSGISGLGLEYVLERIERTRTRRTLERYVSKNLVREILDNPGGYYSSMLGSRKPVTIMFSDLVGFTSLSEKAEPVALVSQLNRYLSAMVPLVFDNGGTLDKFIGDAIMAVWGNVTSHGAMEDAKAAVRAALGMRRAMLKLNEEWRAEGISPLAFGVGINHGEAVIGNIGSYEPHERLDPTVIGDAVNIASRLESLTRKYAVDILVGANVAELVRDDFHLRSVARVQVVGRTEPVDIYTPICARNDETDPEFLKWLQTYEEAIVKFRRRDFKGAKILFSHFLEFYPEDALGRMYLPIALEFEQSPPDEAWNAVEVFKKK